MIASLILLAAVGGTTFVPDRDLGFEGFGEGWNAYRLMGSLRHADIDGNGAPDVVRTDAVFFMQGGRCTGSAPLPVAAGADLPEADLWQRDLYLADNKTLRIFRWENGAWQKTHEQPLTLKGRRPPEDSSSEHLAPEETPGAPPATVTLSRFLHDIDGDGVPEAAWIERDGLEVWVRRDGVYAHAGVAGILPPLRTSEARSWDADGGALTFASRRMFCRVSLLGSALLITEPESLPGGTQVQFHSTRYTLSIGETGVTAERTAANLTPPLPSGMWALRLNDDDVQDYVGEEGRLSRSSAAPLPIKSVWASTDGGKTIQTVRSTSTDSAPNFADFDGDGDLDRLIHRMGVFDGGVREILARALTSSKVRHEIDVYLQDAQGRFSKTPDFRWKGTIELDGPPWRRSEYFLSYLGSELVQIDGDYNGDGRKDLAVHDRLDRIAVHFSGPKGYSAQPDATVPASEAITFTNADVDGDGRSDLILADSATYSVKRLYLSRETKP